MLEKTEGQGYISLHDNVIVFTENINSDAAENKYSFSQKYTHADLKAFYYMILKYPKKFDRYTNLTF